MLSPLVMVMRLSLKMGDPFQSMTGKVGISPESRNAGRRKSLVDYQSCRRVPGPFRQPGAPHPLVLTVRSEQVICPFWGNTMEDEKHWLPGAAPSQTLFPSLPPSCLMWERNPHLVATDALFLSLIKEHAGWPPFASLSTN